MPLYNGSNIVHDAAQMKTSTLSFLIKDASVYLSEKKRGFGKGYLNGYGGKVGEGESIENAAIRELNEEAGLTVNLQKLQRVAIINFFEEDRQIFECHVFFVSVWNGEIKESEEMAQPVLYDLNNLPYERMWDGDRVWLPLVFSGKKIKADVYYEKGMKKVMRFEHKDFV